MGMQNGMLTIGNTMLRTGNVQSGSVEAIALFAAHYGSPCLKAAAGLLTLEMDGWMDGWQRSFESMALLPDLPSIHPFIHSSKHPLRHRYQPMVQSQMQATAHMPRLEAAFVGDGGAAIMCQPPPQIARLTAESTLA